MSQVALDTSTPMNGHSQDPVPIPFNQLCSQCRDIFSDDRSQNHRVSDFHSLEKLEICAGLSCHLCSLLWGSSRFNSRMARRRALLAFKKAKSSAEGSSAPQTKLKARLSLYRTGLSLCLWNRDERTTEPVAEVSFLFTDRPDQPEKFPGSCHTQSEASWQQILQWTQQCSQKHPYCGRRIIPRSEWPTRLLDVGGAEATSIRLRETSELEIEQLKYITLSHCWGKNMPTRLLFSNYSTFIERIPDIELPKTFRDAVEITRKLGLRFLWVDSLCIIQDSNSDWIAESCTMHLVYRNSYLTLAAAAAADATGGLFAARNPTTIVPCFIKCKYGRGSSSALSIYMPEEDEAEEYSSLVLFTRAWVFQERLLSSRSLIFGNREVYWECLELKASEVFPEGLPVWERGSDSKIFELRQQWQQNHRASLLSLLKYWTTIVYRYSGLALSHTTDKLIAVAGLAAEIHRTWGGMHYLAGLWSYRLRRGLLWRCYNGSPFRTPSYTAPSWSWASTDARVTMNDEAAVIDGMAEVLDTHISLTSPADPYGMVKDGYIRMKAPLIRLVLRRKMIGGQWYIIPIVRAQGAKIDETPPDYDNANIFPVEDIEINIELDDRATNDSLQAFVAYLMPLEASLSRREIGLNLEGPVLMPTHLKRGQFRRVGRFCVNDYWDDMFLSDDESEQDLSANSPPIAESDRSGIDSKSSAAQSLEYTLLNRLAIMEISERIGLDDSTPVDNEVAKRFKDWLSKQELKSARRLRKEEDRYCNGIINTELFERYGDMGSCFPNITSFLNYAAIKMSEDLDNGYLDETMYEEAHPNGTLVVQII